MDKGILLIDDEFVFTFINTAMIKNIDSTICVLAASNGNEAINILQGLEDESKPFPQLIFVDLNMPLMNGFEFLEYFKGMNWYSTHATQVVMVTSSINPDDISQGYALGVSHVFTKPLTNQALKKIVENLGWTHIDETD